MPFLELSDIKERQPVPGFHVRFVHTDNMTVAYWDIEAGAIMPEHAHPHEQIVNLLEGELEFVAGKESSTLVPGRVAVIPPDVPHSGRAVTACRVLDVFYPVREDYK